MLVLPLRQEITDSASDWFTGVFPLTLQLPLSKVSVTFAGMGRKVVVAAFALIAAPDPGHAVAPLYDPVALNVGINCQWEPRCQRRELKAMSQAREYIARAHVPLWRIHLCNRNARRSAARVDWIGFNDCIRNRHLQRPPGRGR